MKLFIKILGVIALLASVQAGHAQERDTIVVHDTIYIEKPKKKADIVESTDLVRLKPFGRYDRGIVNYKFLPKGKWVGGLTFSYITFDSKESSILYSLLGNINANFAVKAINPYIGYSLKDNMVIGAKFGYNHLLGDLGNIDLDLGSDMSFSIGDMRYTEDLYSFGVFHRSYVGLDAGGIFGLFNETSLTYKHGTSSYSTDRKAMRRSTLKRPSTSCTWVSTPVSLSILHRMCAPRCRSEWRDSSTGTRSSRMNWEKKARARPAGPTSRSTF